MSALQKTGKGITLANPDRPKWKHCGGIHYVNEVRRWLVAGVGITISGGAGCVAGAIAAGGVALGHRRRNLVAQKRLPRGAW